MSRGSWFWDWENINDVSKNMYEQVCSFFYYQTSNLGFLSPIKESSKGGPNFSNHISWCHNNIMVAAKVCMKYFCRNCDLKNGTFYEMPQKYEWYIFERISRKSCGRLKKKLREGFSLFSNNISGQFFFKKHIKKMVHLDRQYTMFFWKNFLNEIFWKLR